MKQGTIDDFGRFVVEIWKKNKLIQGLFGFINLGKENNINIMEQIFFLGEYQKLLFESIILDISYVLLDKIDDGKSRMQIEVGRVKDKLRNDIDEGIADTNYTVAQKNETLKELDGIGDSTEYGKAIKSIATVRDKHIAHKDPDYLENGLLYKQLQLVVENIVRSYEIRQLVLHNVGLVTIGSIADYSHQNIIEALLLQQKIKTLRKSGEYDMNLLKTHNRFYLDNLDFWNMEIEPRMAVRGDNNE